jgi:hypothetical protein
MAVSSSRVKLWSVSYSTRHPDKRQPADHDGRNSLARTALRPGATDGNATVDSRERFYSAIFAGYGIAWIRAARKSPSGLAGVMLASGVGG